MSEQLHHKRKPDELREVWVLKWDEAKAGDLKNPGFIVRAEEGGWLMFESREHAQAVADYWPWTKATPVRLNLDDPQQLRAQRDELLKQRDELLEAMAILFGDIDEHPISLTKTERLAHAKRVYKAIAHATPEPASK